MRPIAEQTQKMGLGKIALIIGAILAVCLLGLVLFIAAIGAALGGGATAGPPPAACTPGDAENAGMEIPPEYQDFVESAAAESGFSAGVIAAQIYHESGWDPNASSPVGARGLAQFMPATWGSFGKGGDILDPQDAIAAQGRYMGHLRDLMKGHAGSDEELLKLSLASYNAGEGAVARSKYDLEALYNSGAGYRSETAPYVENITTAAEGNYTAECEHGGTAADPDGDIVETAMQLAWEEKVELPFSRAASYGESAARPEYVKVAGRLSADHHTAYYTDCGVFVASVMISSGVDPDYPRRSTGVQINYLRDSGKYKFFKAKSEGEMEPGDILIKPGHTYFYTGERNTSDTGHAQGASLYTRPPSGHQFYLNDTSGGSYFVARHKG